MLRNVKDFLRIVDPSRFVCLKDKVAHTFIVVLSLFLTLRLSTKFDARTAFALAYRDCSKLLIPASGLFIKYRGCLFLARRGTGDLWILNHAFEPYARELFSPYEGDVVVDVGAHVGKYAIPSAKLVGSEGVVFAFEPGIEVYKALQNNININNLSNVIPLNLAAHDQNKDVLLTSSVDGSKGRPIPVKAVTIDEVLESYGIDSVDYVKVDVDGDEVNVLRGMGGILQRSSPKMLVEVAYSNEKEVNDFLNSMGYDGRVVEIGKDGKEYYYTK